MAKAKKKKKDAGYRTAVSGARGVIRILVYVCLAVALIFLGREAYALGYEVFERRLRTRARAETSRYPLRMTCL